MPAKKAAKKRRKQSKHALKAHSKVVADGDAKKDDRRQNAGDVENNNTKEPAEAAAYLTSWESHQTGSGSWKFNKNTQSWLIRHMYEVDKVSKDTFGILLKYLNGLKGSTARSRIRAEASRRALRYKEYSKNLSNNKSSSSDVVTAEDPIVEHNIDKSEPTTKSNNMEVEEEEEKWKNLDDHGKRKEYKRARQILEIFAGKG